MLRDQLQLQVVENNINSQYHSHPVSGAMTV